jgi:DnaJ-class molecular chaperone
LSGAIDWGKIKLSHFSGDWSHPPMEKRTHYMVLGVSHSENTHAIRAAYRDLTRLWHPAVAGAQASRAFQALTHAYDVLSEAWHRREYDDGLRRVADGDMLGDYEPPTEPLIATPLQIFAHRDTIQPSCEAMYERLRRNLTQVGVPKAERPEAINLDVVLTPAETAYGCMVPIVVPVFRRCSECLGARSDWLSQCARCGGQGVVEHEHEVRVRIPPMWPPGSVFEVALDALGIRNFYLRLRISIGTPPV